MAEIKQQILQELNALEEGVMRLRSAANNAGRQTDLEVAILTEQVKNLRDRNKSATDLIDRSIDILKKLK